MSSSLRIDIPKQVDIVIQIVGMASNLDAGGRITEAEARMLEPCFESWGTNILGPFPRHWYVMFIYMATKFIFSVSVVLPLASRLLATLSKNSLFLPLLPDSSPLLRRPEFGHGLLGLNGCSMVAEHTGDLRDVALVSDTDFVGV